MGLLDDLQMGFGLKERTEDYDARTARTIAASEAAGGSNDAMRLAQARNPQHSSFLPVSRSRGAQQYLGSRGYDEGYTPQVAEDDRPFMQRLLFSPESAPSPTPYAIGPLTMDQPLPKFGLLGLLSGLGGMFGRDAQEMGPPQTTVRPMLRPEGFTPPVSAPTSEPEVERPYMSPTTYTNVFSTNRMLGMPYSQPFDYTQFSGLAPEVNGVSYDPAYPVGRDYPTGADVTAEDIEDYLGKVEREGQGMTLITTGPHAGKYMDASGRLVMP